MCSFDLDGAVVQKGSYGTAKTVSYTVDAAGTWTVRVYVKDGAGVSATLDNAGAVTVTAGAPSISGVTPSKTTASVGSSITWTANASGGTGTLKYCFYIFRNGAVVQKGSYGTAKTVSYTVDAAGTWTVRVYVKDGAGTVATLDNAGKVTVS